MCLWCFGPTEHKVLKCASINFSAMTEKFGTKHFGTGVSKVYNIISRSFQ